MERSQIIKQFAQKALIEIKEVEQYDEITKSVFEELLENGCIKFSKMKTISESATSNEMFHGEAESYYVVPFSIQENYKELF